MDEELKGSTAKLIVAGAGADHAEPALVPLLIGSFLNGEVIGVCDVQHATQTEFLPFLALPRALAGKRIALVVLDDE